MVGLQSVQIATGIFREAPGSERHVQVTVSSRNLEQVLKDAPLTDNLVPRCHCPIGVVHHKDWELPEHCIFRKLITWGTQF